MFPSRLSSRPERADLGSASLNSLDEGRLLPVIRISGCSWRSPLAHAEPIEMEGGPMTTARVRAVLVDWAAAGSLTLFRRDPGLMPLQTMLVAPKGPRRRV